jgi:hypothetical protein
LETIGVVAFFMSPNIQYILQRLESLFLGSIFLGCSKLGGVQCHPGSKFLFFFSAQTTLLLATVWIMRSFTVTCLMSAFSSPRCTKRIQAVRPDAVLAPRARDQSYKCYKDLSYK